MADNTIAMKWVVLPGLDGTGDLAERFATLANALTVRYDPEFAGGGSAEEIRATHVNQALAQLPGHGRLLLIAESFSGAIALEMAKPLGDRVAAVVLCASFTRSPAPWFLRCLLPLAARAVKRPPAFLAKRYLLGDDATPEDIQLFYRALDKVSEQTIRMRLRSICDLAPTRDPRPPRTLALVGTRDRLLKSPPDGADKVEELDSPHLMLFRRPAEVLRSIEAFVREEGLSG